MTVTLDAKVSDAPAESNNRRIDLMAKRLDKSKLHELGVYHIGEYQILKERKGLNGAAATPLSTHTTIDDALQGLIHPDARILRLDGIAPQDYNNVVHIAQNLYKTNIKQ